MEAHIVKGLSIARSVLDDGWAVYELSPEEAQTEAREALIRRAVETGFPKLGLPLSPADLGLLATEARDARRSWVELLRLRVDHDGNGSDGPGTDGVEADELAAWGAGVAARQADDWVTLLDRLRRATRHYQVLDEADAAPPARRRTVRRLVRHCASDLRIAPPRLQWIRPVRQDGDLVTLGDIAGCALTLKGQPVIFVRSDIVDERDQLRVVAHEVAHHAGADEAAARAYEQTALRIRHRLRRRR